MPSSDWRITEPEVLAGFENGIYYWPGKDGQLQADIPWEFHGLNDNYDDDLANTARVANQELMRLSEAFRALPKDARTRTHALAWNDRTKRWHPMAETGGDETAYAAEALPDHLSREYSQPLFLSGDGSDTSSAVSFGNLAEAQRRFRGDYASMVESHAARRGLDRKAMKESPEYRREYLRIAKEQGLAPGGRYEQQAPLDLATASPRRREFELPLDVSVDQPEPGPTGKNFRRYGYGAAMLAPLLLAPSKEGQQ
jgi:hypothetical protein